MIQIHIWILLPPRSIDHQFWYLVGPQDWPAGAAGLGAGASEFRLELCADPPGGRFAVGLLSVFYD